MDIDYKVAPGLVLIAGVLVVWLCVGRLRSPARKDLRPWPRRLGGAGLGLLAAVAAILAVSSVWNAVALHRFWAAHPAGGALLAVAGHRMHIDCTGSGEPTLVLDAGLGSDSLIWGAVQPVLSRTTRVCSYDRAGFGWSDEGSAPRDADHIAIELHDLLRHSSIEGPVVLVGHSIAGLYLRDYATRYPGEVAGLVLVDASTPLQETKPGFALTGHAPPGWLLRGALIAGLPRLIGMCAGSSRASDPALARLQAEDLCRLRFHALEAEQESFYRSGVETAASGPYGALPVLVFSHDPAKVLEGSNDARSQRQQTAWSQMQEELKRLSTHSRRIIARGCDHYLFLERPQLVETEVARFVEQIRGTAPPPATFGDTVTE